MKRRKITAVAQKAILLAQHEARKTKSSLSQMPCRVFRTENRRKRSFGTVSGTPCTIFSSKKKAEKKT